MNGPTLLACAISAFAAVVTYIALSKLLQGGG